MQEWRQTNSLCTRSSACQFSLLPATCCSCVFNSTTAICQLCIDVCRPTHQHTPLWCHVTTTSLQQVEARLRQLEGRSLASDSAKAKGKQQPSPYNAAAEQAGGSGLLAAGGAKAYNAAADVVPVSCMLLGVVGVSDWGSGVRAEGLAGE